MKATLNRATFKTSRLLDFASEKELIAQTGHRRDAWPLVVLKELVDNALDACEEAGIAPEIDVVVDPTGITVRDNGPGIPAETVQGVLDFAVRVSSREAYVSPTRGAQGNALKTLVAMPFVLSGERGRVEITARGVRHEIVLEVDRIRQEPRVQHRAQEAGIVRNGTSVHLHWPDSASSILLDAKTRFLQFASDFAWLNPHLKLRVQWGEVEESFEATNPAWKKWSPNQPTCSHWYQAQNLERLVAAYVAHDAERGQERTVRQLVSEFAGLSSTAKQKSVLDATGLTRTNLSGLLKDGGVDRARVESLLGAMKGQTRPVKPQALGTLGREHLEQRYREVNCQIESFKYQKVCDVTGGLPQVTECAFAWLGENSQAHRRLITGVNWSPGIVNPFRELGRFGRSLDSVLEEQRAGRQEPVVLLLHVACPRVEYTDRGKSAVVATDDVDEVEEEENQ